MEIKTFILKFVKAFNVGRANSRFALLTYTKYVDVFMTLNKYSGESDLISLLDLLDEGSSNVKNTALALKEMMKMFSSEQVKKGKKLPLFLRMDFQFVCFFCCYDNQKGESTFSVLCSCFWTVPSAIWEIFYDFHIFSNLFRKDFGE